jgi:hypothetical protein
MDPCRAEVKEMFPMQIHRFCAFLLAATLTMAGPAPANQGGGGGGKVSDRNWEQQQAPAAAPNDTAVAAARATYTAAVAGLDAAIQEVRRRIAGRDRKISKFDHRIATDFAADRADDKTTDDMRRSADNALKPFEKTLKLAMKGVPIDRDLVNVLMEVTVFRSDIAALETLEKARADMAKAAQAFGATIN